MREGAYLHLRVTGREMDFAEITKATGMEPTVVFKKGTKISNKYVNNVLIEDCWQADYEVSPEQSLESAINCFLSSCFNKTERPVWPDHTSAALWATVYPEERYTSMLISKELLNKLASLDLDFGIFVTDLSDFCKTGDDGPLS